MSRKRQGMTMAEHEKVGQALDRVSRALREVAALAAGRYPITGREMKRYGAASRTLSELRSAFDAAVFGEHPEAPLTTYYGRDRSGGGDS